MHRRDFGSWGAELSEDDFACALAALGVLESPPENDATSIADELSTLGSDGVNVVPWRVRWWQHLLLPMAEPLILADRLAVGWKRSQLVGTARLEIDRFAPLWAGFDPPSTLPWISNALSRPAVRARSVFARVDEPPASVCWQWPLRLGFFDDPASRALSDEFRASLSTTPWILPLSTVVDMQGPLAECELLVLPMDLRAALSAVAAQRMMPRADCVVVLGRHQGTADHWYRLVMGLRAAALTSGVILTNLPIRRHVEWITNVVRELSHNSPLDVAAFVAAREAKAQSSFIMLSGKLAEFSRLTSQMHRMGVELSTRQYQNVALDILADSSTQQTLGVGPGPISLSEIGERLENISTQAEGLSDPFKREIDAATAVAEIASAAAAAIESAPTPRSAEHVAESRFIQARVFEQPNQERRYSLRANQPHEVRVRVGLSSQEWNTVPADSQFPSDKLSPDQDAHELTIVFVEPKLLDEPQSARITLPRFGNSTECSFHLFARKEVGQLDARIIVVHRNRVLQTALCQATIVDGDDAETDGSIVLKPELAVRPSLDDLGHRQIFDAALVLNHDATGISGITALLDDSPVRFTPSQTMNDEVANLDILLTQVVNEPKSYMGDLTSDAITGLLRQFAQHGSLLYDHIVRDGGLEHTGLDGDGPLQVVSAVADARLPVEFIYGREAPTKGASLCPNAANSLLRGACQARCMNSVKERDVICPLAFWGLRRIIERHGPDQRFKLLLGGDAYAIQSDPTTRRGTLEVLRAGLVAASQRVDKTVKGGTKRICDRLKAGATATLEPVADWATWEQHIETNTPSLLILVVHTAASPENPTIQQMEIGVESWLTVAELEFRHVRRRDAPPPLVLLLGCETGVPDRQFANFVNRLRNRGAAVVVAAGAKIHSIHAVPVAAAFVDALRTATKRDGATLGEVMRDVRREMLARGIPMVLTLTAFGDAGWRLAKSVHQRRRRHGHDRNASSRSGRLPVDRVR